MALLALIYFIGVEMSELTPEQIAIVKPFLDELEVVVLFLGDVAISTLFLSRTNVTMLLYHFSPQLSF